MVDKNFKERTAFRIGIINLVILLLAGGAWAATLTVDDSGGEDFLRIQDAIDNASDGDTILVFSGTYVENVDVNKQLNLSGIGRPVVDGNRTGSAITLSAGRSVLDGFETINTQLPHAGIDVVSDNNVITNNSAPRNSVGIILRSSSNNTLEGNDISGDLRSDGIILDSSSNNTLNDNRVSDHLFGILIEESSNNMLNDNFATGNDFGIRVTGDNNMLNNNDAVSNLDIGINIIGNNNILSGNTASFNIVESGISIEGNNNILSGNTALNNQGSGIGIMGSNNILSDNDASSNDIGIFLLSSSNNVLSGNVVQSNENGIRLDNSNGNTIFNNFFNNPNNALDDGINIWNITKTAGTNIIGGPQLGGNFWSDYTGEDLDGDGLGDTLIPHNSSGGIAIGGDFLPLVTPTPVPTPTPTPTPTPAPTPTPTPPIPVPEFPIGIVLPVIGILGMMLLLIRRRD